MPQGGLGLKFARLHKLFHSFKGILGAISKSRVFQVGIETMIRMLGEVEGLVPVSNPSRALGSLFDGVIGRGWGRTVAWIIS